MATPQALIEHALEVATADHTVVLLRQSSTANLRWANNTLTTNGVSKAVQVTVVSVVEGSGGTCAGVLTQSATTPEQVEAVVAAAEEAARRASPAEDAADLASGEQAPDWDDEPAETSIDVFEGFTADLGRTLTKAADADRLLYGYAEHDLTTTYLATSTGLARRHVQPTGHIGITGKPRDLSTSAWVGAPTLDFADIDVEALDAELGRRIGWAGRKVELEAGRYETLLPPTAVADLVLYAYFVSSGREAHEGQTAYSSPGGGTRLGDRVVKSEVSLSSDPAYDGLSSAPFVATASTDSATSVFDNGLDISPARWITDGMLTSLATSRHTARLTGLPQAQFVDNLRLDVAGGSGDVDDLVANTERGLLLTCLWYIRQVDPQELLLTGLTRDGVYLVEDGRVTGAVNNFRFNESPLSLLNRFSEAGTTRRTVSREWGEWFPRTAMPALRIPDFNMSSVSQAS